ncbi:hypothetical protein JHK82_016092 [Glycine max]|nr:hypothetical protein JHK85_016491 [Glycine max]KAG5149211.1 hypothetical protein JHK82_016092 [Glycine max]
MAKFETSSSVGMLAIVEDRDGVDVGIEDGPHASRCDGDGLTSVRGGDGVGATSKDLTGIDTVDMDGVDDARLSLGSFITYEYNEYEQVRSHNREKEEAPAVGDDEDPRAQLAPVVKLK